MAKTTKAANTSETYPHQDLISESGVKTSELPEKTQKAIAAFNSETDEVKKDALDQTIYGQIDAYLEAKEAKKDDDKDEEGKEKGAKAKPKMDVSGAGTAQKTKAAEDAEKKKKEAGEAPKTRSIFKTMFGHK